MFRETTDTNIDNKYGDTFLSRGDTDKFKIHGRTITSKTMDLDELEYSL